MLIFLTCKQSQTKCKWPSEGNTEPSSTKRQNKAACLSNVNIVTIEKNWYGMFPRTFRPCEESFLRDSPAETTAYVKGL
ncbi:uncharacterized protein [Mytilus edulis]|uniref:uncharacterized protein isoform X2 n=1 Tax=Mytilus edulis TaxID=6550 RepID=UPI0039EE9B5B